MTAEEKQFIKNNIGADVGKLLLNPPAPFSSNIRWLADQIKARQKAKDKLPDWYANFDLIFPPPLSVEQCSSQATAGYKTRLIKGGTLVDLTGGMGVDTLTLAGNFDKTIYVEQDAELCERLRHNASVLSTPVEVVNATAESFLTQIDLPSGPVTFFIDPSRRDQHARKVFRFADCSPNIAELLPKFKELGATVLIKASPLIDLKLGIEELGAVKEIHVLSVKNDCKEVLFLLDFRFKEESAIHAVNLTPDGEETFIFHFSEEEQAQVKYADAQKYLLLPNASILKAGAFRSVADRFGLEKISPNTHLYTSDHPVVDFPGRQFEILDEPVSPALKKANVITRNYPLTPQQILKKYKLKEGGEKYVVGFRDQRNIPHLVTCRHW